MPTNYAWIKNGVIYGLHDFNITSDNIIEFLCSVEKSVLKWIDRGGGEGTYIFENNNNEIYVNGKKTVSEEIIKLFQRKGNAILCEYMTQSVFSASLYPNTTNTIRILLGLFVLKERMINMQK